MDDTQKGNITVELTTTLFKDPKDLPETKDSFQNYMSDLAQQLKAANEEISRLKEEVSMAETYGMSWQTGEPPSAYWYYEYCHGPMWLDPVWWRSPSHHLYRDKTLRWAGPLPHEPQKIQIDSDAAIKEVGNE